jgi:hypothetical protein
LTHVLILQGTAGPPSPRQISLVRVTNPSTIGDARLDYVNRHQLNQTRVVNANTFGAQVLNHIVVRSINQAQVVNASTFGAPELVLVPFVPVNSETTDLLNFFDQVYTTTEKRQIDTLITQLKTAGVWAKFDWYGNANWAHSEHDALVNWKNVAQSLVRVGGVSWSEGVGLIGDDPLANSRYKSDWQVSDGPHAAATSIAFFTKITAISAPQNGMQPIGVWRRDISGGPSTPNGLFLSMSITANTGFAGADLESGNGNTSFAPGDGLGVWGVSHSGGTQITVKDGATLETDAVSGTASYTDPDGMSVAGSAGAARRSFPGTEMYWGWGGALTAVEFAAIEAAYQTALLPPVVITDALLLTSGSDADYLLVTAGNDDDYLKV